MAFACTTMELQDRRLSICKASASKISKPSPVLRNLSVTSSPSSAPPTSQLPSSITSSPSRPIAKVVNADPSSFRRVVQELTGTTLPSASSASSSTSQSTPRSLSRLQRIAPPPLRSGMRTLKDPHHHQNIIQQMQQNQQASQTSVQRNISKVGSLSPTLSVNQFGNRHLDPASDLTSQSGNPSPSCIPSLPMLSPHLLSPLPALTPGDNTWANPIDVISHSPNPVQGTSSVPPPLLQLPTVSTGCCYNGHRSFMLAKPVYTRSGEAMPRKMATLPLTLQTISAALPSQGGALPPLLSTPPPLPWPMPHVPSTINELPPWSPSPIPFSPGLFPPSPSGLGPPPPLPLPLSLPMPLSSSPPMLAMPHVNNANLYSNSKYSTLYHPNMSRNFSF